MTEADIQSAVSLAIGARPGVRVFRNTVGTGWTGESTNTTIQGRPDLTVIRNARRVTFGLATGSPDLVGWREIVITADMIGETIAQFLGGEIKKPGGRIDSLQNTFLDALARAGGLSAVWRDPESALRDVTSRNPFPGRIM